MESPQALFEDCPATALKAVKRPAGKQGRVGRREQLGGAHLIFRQLFDSVSCTYTYLLADRRGGEALIIDPVLEKVDHYAQLMRELGREAG